MPAPQEWVDAVRRGDATAHTVDAQRIVIVWGDDLLMVEIASGKAVPFWIVPRADTEDCDGI